MVLPNEWRRHCGRRPLARLLVPSLWWPMRLARPSRARQAPGRRDLRAHPVIVLSAVFAQRPFCRLEMLTAERP